MKNITVSVDDDTYRIARIKAAERDSSVSRLVREFLKGLAAGESGVDRLAGLKAARADEERERRVDEIVARFRAIIPPDSDVWKTMEEMYDENGLPR